ncbi:hypothetical protein Cgig2_022532 [Carnegiea gigantea]|uniref:CWF19-like protein 2 n=1 Tax=Carnegiea gigantea TaxID=171969 RepID=A0A9Q1JP17_9CARY|nr:hypothetical protein Cgig2_022532 [Carnegiea gigantea]
MHLPQPLISPQIVQILQHAGREHHNKNASVCRLDMRVPKIDDSLCWGRRKSRDIHKKGADAEILGSHSEPVVQKSAEEKPLGVNRIAAKAIQLRLKGKHEEAQKLLDHNPQKKQEMGNKGFLMSALLEYVNKEEVQSARAEQEKMGKAEQEKGERSVNLRNYVSAGRPKHLVVAIANFTYLMLPQFQPVASGHCCIMTLQHELGSRMADDNVWEEIRNFKKCLILMFVKQDKEVIFLETLMGLGQQRCHCLIDCIPLPRDIAKAATLYFKKAIDEAEDQWSQHNAKKLIDTSDKGLRSSIPKHFPCFHVEFGLKRGFVHVIDDETQFKSSFGLNVIRGMLQTQDEDMYCRRMYESIEVQRQAVAAFPRDWKPFDWTRQLD